MTNVSPTINIVGLFCYLELDLLGIEFTIPVALTIAGGLYGVWKDLRNRAEKDKEKQEKRFKELEDAQNKFLDKDALDKMITAINTRLDKMEEHRAAYVTREEFGEGQRRIEDLVERLTQAVSQTNINLTGRIDTVLFQLSKRDQK